MEVRSLAIWALTVGGCTFVPLSEVPIDGGTDEQNRLIEEELRFFEESIGVGRLEIRTVKLGKRSSYGISTRTVHLQADLEGNELREVLRHELCHALDYSEDMLNRPEPAFDDIIDGFLSTMPKSKRRQRGEVMAGLCQSGPLGAQLLSTPCPGDAPVRAGARFLLDEVWLGEPLWQASSDAPVSHAVDDLHAAGLEAHLYSGVEAHPQEDWLRLGLWGDYRTVVDIHTGHPITDPPPPAPKWDDEEFAQSASLALAELLVSGPNAVTLGVVALDNYGASAGRGVVYSPETETWVPVVGACDVRKEEVFFASNQVYRARLPTEESPEFTWWPLHLEPARLR